MRAAWLAIGFLCAAQAAAEPLYRLPWADGRNSMIVQGPGGRITSHFSKATLQAVDFEMPEGTPVVAARDGVVEAAEAGQRPEDDPLTYEGNFVRVRHADGTAAIYAHLRYRGVTVAPGRTVRAGDLIGYSGGSGDVDEPHLHFAVIREETNADGFREEVSLPVRFYVGEPPLSFPARAAMRVTADYSGPPKPPRFAVDGRLVPPQRPTLEPGEEAGAWATLALWLLAGATAIAWFWRFSRG